MKYKIVLLVSFILLIITLVALQTYSQYSDPPSRTQLDSSSSALVVQVASPIPGWQTYTDRVYHYEIQYPAVWKIEKACLGGHKNDTYICLQSPSFVQNPVPDTTKGLLITVAPPDSSYFIAANPVSEFCRENDMFKYKSCENLILNGLQIIKKVWANYSWVDVAILGNDGKARIAIRLEYPAPPGLSDTTFDQILSTFRFTD